MLALHFRPGVDALAAEFVAGDVQPGAQQPVIGILAAYWHYPRKDIH